MKGNKDTNYKYCKFVTDKYIAVYQYYNIKDGISYDELWCQIKSELDRARIIVENDKWPMQNKESIVEQLYKKDRFAALLIYLYMMRETDKNTYISSRNLENSLTKQRKSC